MDSQSLCISIIFLTLLSSTIDAFQYRSVRQIAVDQCSNPNPNACNFVTCENGGRCIEDPTTTDCFKCQCGAGYTGRICDTPIAIIPTGCNPGCQNGGVCNINVCVCGVGFTGPLCQTRDYCLPSNPCQNGGRCISTTTNYVCDCTGTGYTGMICTDLISTNPCGSNPCQNGGQCSWNGEILTCICTGGYLGIFCQIPPVPCSGTVCENGGNCGLIAENTYGCVCPEEFTGPRCETFILASHPCVTMPTTVCQNGGVCIPSGVDYLCKCAVGWSGTNCQIKETIISCDPNPCGIHGSCEQAILASGSIPYCTCENGWTGRYCDVNIDVSCPVGYCLSGGTCLLNGNIPYCRCSALYTGQRCETLVGALITTTPTVPGAKPCSSNPCQNGGTCYSDSVVFVCACPPNWTGPTCSIYETAIVTTTSSPVARPCLSNPCKNGATCYSDSVMFVCACPPGWTGATCEFFQTVIITSTFTTPSDGITCANRPCRNGGVCYSIGNSYYCYCGSNNIYTGKNCETIIPIISSNCPLNCAPGYCVPSGSSINPYVCMCDGTMKPKSCT